MSFFLSAMKCFLENHTDRHSIGGGGRGKKGMGRMRERKGKRGEGGEERGGGGEARG